jgi:calcineurin-like phosphoesterase family protein
LAHFYTADLHLNHSSIIHFCKRPFADASEMDQAILQNLEAAVGRDDDLWIVGDFAFAREIERASVERYFERIPGRKHLIVGNHDKPWVCKLGWASVNDIVSVQDGDQWFLLCHYPMMTWNHARRGSVHLFGHVHNNWHGSRNSVNVCIDLWDFKPMQAGDILRRAKTLPKNKHWHDVEPGADVGDEDQEAKWGLIDTRPRG